MICQREGSGGLVVNSRRESFVDEVVVVADSLAFEGDRVCVML